MLSLARRASMNLIVERETALQLFAPRKCCLQYILIESVERMGIDAVAGLASAGLRVLIVTGKWIGAGVMQPLIGRSRSIAPAAVWRTRSRPVKIPRGTPSASSTTTAPT